MQPLDLIDYFLLAMIGAGVWITLALMRYYSDRDYNKYVVDPSPRTWWESFQ